MFGGKWNTYVHTYISGTNYTKTQWQPFDTCPLGGHNYNSKVERRVRHIKESLDKSCQNERLSIFQWETVSSEVTNAVNDLPLALGNIVSDNKNMDLLTPNKLMLGRNNERSPVSPISVSGNFSWKYINKYTSIWYGPWNCTKSRWYHLKCCYKLQRRSGKRE